MHEIHEVVEWMTGTGPGRRAGPGLSGVLLGGAARARTVADGPLRLAVVGECGAEEAELHRALAAVAAGRWAELTTWAGSYWVIADRPGERLVCGDLANVRGVFYTLTAHDEVRWATSPHLLASQTGAGVDLPLLAARTVAGEQHWPHHSPYTGVRAVPGGWGLHLTDDAVRLVDVTAVPEPVGLWEGADRFGQAFNEAVALRMRAGEGPVGADLSGGLDSSTAVLLAARQGEVRAVTYADPLTSAEDTAFAARVADHAGVWHRTAAGGQDELPFAFPAGAPAGDEPTLDAANTGMDSCYLAPVAGLRAHLTGHGGDVVLDASSACFPGLVQAGQRRRAHRQVVAWARLHNTAPGPLWQQVKDTADGYPHALAQTAQTLETGPVFAAPAHGAWSWLKLGTAATWLTADGRAAVAAWLRRAAQGAGEVRAEEFDQWAALRATGACARTSTPLYAALGVRPVHPYLDNQVVRAAFAIPAFDRHSTVSYKPLLAAALPDLPGWLTSRRSKGAFTAQRIAGLARHLARLRSLIADSPLVTAGLLDADAALRFLEAAARGERAAGLAELHQLLVTCHWLVTGPAPAPAWAPGVRSC
ncbi:lasso peptide isopeptide bond-forming cyclase [Streptomyces calidiresistens]|nr:asparagine synthase-related protein [Streptomyces calidiresistens]